MQRHLYGRGWERRGLPVEWVATAYLPLAGELSDAVFEFEDYDEGVALDALSRLERIQASVADGRSALPALSTQDAYCQYCPFMKADAADFEAACPGHAAITATQEVSE